MMTTFFKQVLGLPMGGYLSVNIAGIILNHFLNKTFISTKIKSKLRKMYIVNIILMID